MLVTSKHGKEKVDKQEDVIIMLFKFTYTLFSTIERMSQNALVFWVVTTGSLWEHAHCYNVQENSKFYKGFWCTC